MPTEGVVMLQHHLLRCCFDGDEPLITILESKGGNIRSLHAWACDVITALGPCATSDILHDVGAIVSAPDDVLEIVIVAVEVHVGPVLLQKFANLCKLWLAAMLL